MSMIDLKSSALAALDGTYKPNGKSKPRGDRLSADRVLHDAAADVEEGIAFWKTLGGNSQPKRGRSPRVYKSQWLNLRSLQ